MKSKLVILSLMVAAASTATAQTKEKYVAEKAYDNIFLSIGVGANASMYKEGSINFGKGIAPHITLSLGKWITPTWGIRAQGGLWRDKVYSGFGKSGPLDGLQLLRGDKESYSMTTGRARIDAMYNITNAIMGYNSDRIFSLSAFAGPGMTFARPYTAMTIANNGNGSWTKTLSDKKVRAYVNGSVGLLAKFNVSNYFDIDLEARGELSPSYYGTLVHPSKTTGALYLTVGATYTFGGKKWVTCDGKVDMSGINDELNRYRSRLAQAEADLAACRNALANQKPQAPTEVVKEIKVAGPRAIFFKLGSAKFDDYGKVNIDMAAKIMKENPNKKYKVMGYADSATGSSSLNQTLTEKRAQAVYDALVAQGVNRDQLEIVANGGTDDMFYNSNALNRVVILE